MKKISALAVAGIFTASLAATAFAADVKVGGEIRVRAESVSNESDGQKEQRQYIQRTRLNVDAKIDETSKAFIQLQDSRAWGSDGSTDGTGTGTDSTAVADTTESVDVKQAYFQLDKLFDQPLSLKVGRQVMAYGEHRVIGGFEWSNTARSFDAIKLMYNTDAFSVDAWTSKLMESTTNDANDFKTVANPDDDSDFNGIYATIKAIPNNTVDLYLLQDTNNGTDTTEKNVITYGARLNGKVAGLDYTGEVATQTGDAAKSTTNYTGPANSNALDVDALAYAVKAGYTIPAALGLRIGAEYDYASGDDNTLDGDLEAFQVLYPTAHPIYGFTDDQQWTNLKAWSVNASVKPAKGLWVGVEYWRYETAEDVTKANKTTGTAIAGTSTDDAGSEINIMARYKLSDNVGLEAAWVQRENGDASVTKDYYGRSIADGDVSTFSYLQANVTF